MSIFEYQFMQNAILTAFLGGIACGSIGVFVVLMHMPFIGSTGVALGQYPYQYQS